MGFLPLDYYQPELLMCLHAISSTLASQSHLLIVDSVSTDYQLGTNWKLLQNIPEFYSLSRLTSTALIICFNV